jgi:DNA-binding MarR family transcriptional regulator
LTSAYRSLAVGTDANALEAARARAMIAVLDLYAAEHESRAVGVTSASIAAGVPVTTGLRWVNVLIDKGLLESSMSQHDGRVRILRLTDRSRVAIRQMLDAAAAMMGAANRS